MRYTKLVPLLAVAATAIVIPDDATAQQLVLEAEKPSVEVYEDTVTNWWQALRSTVEETVDSISKGTHKIVDELSELNLLNSILAPGDPDAILGLGRGGHGGHDGQNLTDLTIYEAIHKSNHSKKFAKLVDDFPDIVKLLNSTDSKVTAFVPVDEAFDKIPEHHPKPPKEFIEKILEYHILRDEYPAGRLFGEHTVPTALKGERLGGRPQRLRISVSLFGLRINFYSRVVLGNMFTKNGVIHAIDSILVPPPPARRLISLFPSKFSTLELAAEKTGMLPHHDEPSKDGKQDKCEGDDSEPTCYTTGLTVFAPTNFAFRKLGPGTNAFLFNTKKGLSYLRAIIKYHLVVNETLYSDEFYGNKDKAEGQGDDDRGHYHVDLPTLLDHKSLSIDIAHWYRLVNIRINGYTNVAIEDGISMDGVIQVLNSVLIPPRDPKHGHDWVEADEEISVEELIERLKPYVEDEDEGEKESIDDGMDEVWGDL